VTVNFYLFATIDINKISVGLSSVSFTDETYFLDVSEGLMANRTLLLRTYSHMKPLPLPTISKKIRNGIHVCQGLNDRPITLARIPGWRLINIAVRGLGRQLGL
jgi:hypothetical protein